MSINEPTLYIGIGASAGGLEALEVFFSSMPSNSGLAFIVVQHLSPDYKSLMVELLSKRTQMMVFRAESGMRVETNCIYLIPPKKNLKIFHGKLILSEQDYSKGINLPIDIFLHSLADDQGEKAIAIILSGTGSDGMRGIRAIKESAGMVMVQSQESAKFDGMPRSAISTGLPDFILAPNEMPDQLISFAKHPYVNKSSTSTPLLTDEDGLTRIFALLREQCKVDFTYYKPSTVNRRIERRMSINQTENLNDYVRLLENRPQETTTLYRELLIGVTNFFRDREAFDFIKNQVFPTLLQGKEHQEIRLWVAGCSTGEEAYSLAILCKDYMNQVGQKYNIKIFATDIDQEAIIRAGNGIYPESITADLPPSYLSTYFTRKDDHFHISHTLREMVVFAPHNIIKDPPFTNIDLISCRNLLIYLQPVLQKKVLELFNYSLNPTGVLFLGTSETTGELADYFDLIHHKWKVYRSKGKQRNVPGATDFSNNLKDDSSSFRRSYTTYPMVRPHNEERLYERFLSTLADRHLPLSLIVNEKKEVLHIVGDTSDYFKVPSGRMNNDIVKMAVKELSIPLATGIQKVFVQQKELRYTNIRLPSKTIQLQIIPFKEQTNLDPLAVVLISEIQPPQSPTESDVPTYDFDRESQQRIEDLEQELQFTRENLQATIEELETANEELQATNEELLASNEELQSTNEELQSVNEELYTVNAEYQSKILELKDLNNDMDNIFSSTQIGFLLLDENFEIRKFSPNVYNIFNLTEKHIGLRVNDLNHKVNNTNPVEIILSAKGITEPLDHEIQTQDGNWHLMRVVPYHINSDYDSGYVITFLNITSLKKIQSQLHETEHPNHAILDSLSHNIAILDENGTIVYANNAWKTFARENGLNDDYLGANYLKLCENAHGDCADEAPLVAEAIHDILAGRREMFSIRYPCHSPIKERWFLMFINRVIGTAPNRVVVLHMDITSLKQGVQSQ